MQFAEKLISVRPDIPVIICTGFSERINKKVADVMGIRGIADEIVGNEESSPKNAGSIGFNERIV